MNQSVKDEAVETLTCLGLNCSQAKVYLALVENGLSTAKKIFKISGVNRQEIYRIMPKLQNSCLAEKIIGIPTRWRATPLRDGLSFLLENREKETSELQTKATKIINYIKEKKERARLREEECQFVMMPGKDAIIKRLIKTIEKTQKSIDVSTTWKRFKSACYRLAEPLEEAWRRGVKGRVVIEETEEPVLEFVKTYWRTPHAEIRQVRFPPKTVMAMYDKKEVYIYVIPTANMTESPALWSNNPSLVAMAEDSFETKWKTAQQLSVM